MLPNLRTEGMGAEKVKLIEAIVPGLVVPAAGDTFYWDSEIAGFGLRVSARGKRTWVAQYRFGAKQSRHKVGQWPELRADKARKQARDVLAAARNGRNPQEAKDEARERAAVNLGFVASLYLARKVEPWQRPNTVVERRRHLDRDWRPLHGLILARVGRAQVAAELARIATDHGPIAANRSRGTLHAMFVWAMGEGLAEINPVVGANKPGVERSRDRTLALAELRAVWEATAEKGDFNAIVRLLMLTGQRREEVAGMRWAEVNLDKALWSLPGSRTKNGRAHDVPLSDATARLIASLERRKGRELVFGRGEGGFSGWSQSKDRLDGKIAKMQAEATGKEERADAQKLSNWTLHDLRRTVATQMAEGGAQPHVVEAIMNHVSGHKAGVAGIYNKAVYAAEKRAALDRWAEHVLATASDSTAAGVKPTGQGD